MIEAIPEHARFHADRATLCAMVETILREREGGYPAAIAEGKLSAADAERGLAHCRAMVAEWRWATDALAPDLPPFGEFGHFGAYNFALAEEAATIATRAATRAKARPADTDAALRAELCAAIAWLQQCQPGCPGISRLSFDTIVDRRIAGRFTEAKAA
jgi:hypothetical protein